MSSEPQAGEEVDAQDAGVPNDSPGPDVPEDSSGSESPDVPVDPNIDQPEGVAEVEGADFGDPDDDTGGLAQTKDADDAASDAGSTD